MDCDEARTEALALHSGNLAAEESAAVAKHLAECAACRETARQEQSALALFRSAGDLAPSEHVWQGIRAGIERARGAQPRSLRTLIRVAAAAGILVAALSFVFVAINRRPGHAATISAVAPDAPDLRPGTRLATGETFVAPTYVVLTLPDVGLLKLNRDTEIRFDTPTRVRLTRGELFAEVTRGFVVESRDATVTVKGTRFGVTADDAPSAVYVVEGKVEVASTSGTVLLESGRTASVGGAVEPIREGQLEWMAGHESILLALGIRERIVKLGDSPAWGISFRTNSSAPLTLEPVGEMPLYLRVVNPDRKEYATSLSRLTVVEARRGANGTVRLDVMTPCALTMRVEPSLFPAAGRYTVTLVYQGRQGVLQSDPIQIEVR